MRPATPRVATHTPSGPHGWRMFTEVPSEFRAAPGTGKPYIHAAHIQRWSQWDMDESKPTFTDVDSESQRGEGPAQGHPALWGRACSDPVFQPPESAKDSGKETKRVTVWGQGIEEPWKLA